MSKFRHYVAGVGPRTDDASPAVLSAYHHMPPHSPQITLLIVGMPKSGKTTFSRALLEHARVTNVPLSVRKASELPLPNKERPRIDFIVFMVDMTNNQSFTNLKSNLQKVDPEYFVQGKSCILATRFDLQQKFAFKTEELGSLVETYTITDFYVNLTDKELLNDIAKRIAKQAGLSSLYEQTGTRSYMFFRTLDNQFPMPSFDLDAPDPDGSVLITASPLPIMTRSLLHRGDVGE